MFLDSKAETCKGLCKLVILTVRVCSKAAFIQHESSFGTERALVNAYRGYIRQEHIVASERYNVKDLTLKADGALRDRWR